MSTCNKKVEVHKDANYNKYLIDGRRIVLHCHHYNCFLQRTLEDALPQYMVGIQRRAAAEIVHDVLSSVFSDLSRDEQDFSKCVLDYASKLYTMIGMGTIDFSGVTEQGGTVRSPISHYAFTWLEKWGSRDEPVCHFTSGFILATFSFAFGKSLDECTVNEDKCLVQHEDECQFSVKVS